MKRLLAAAALSVGLLFSAASSAYHGREHCVEWERVVYYEYGRRIVEHECVRWSGRHYVREYERRDRYWRERYREDRYRRHRPSVEWRIELERRW